MSDKENTVKFAYPPESAESDGKYIRYSEEVEKIEPDEQETFQKIVAAMGKAGEVTRERYGHAVRTSHAKAHGLLKGELKVHPHLPEFLRQGLFAEERSYPVIVRLAHVPGEFLDDREVSTPRGMAIKVLGVHGPMLPVHRGESTQDFVLDTGKAFNAPNAKIFLAAITATAGAAPHLPTAVKGAVSAVSRLTNEALHAVGANSANLDFFGHPFKHPLGESYFSQAPILYGSYIAKLCVVPDTAGLKELAEQKFEPLDENGLRTAVVKFFRTHAAEFEVGIQLCTDIDAMPVEDASKEWPEDASPYQSVGRLYFPVQDAYSEARQEFVNRDLAFSPSHSLAAHRPLGSLMRARMAAYEALGRARLQQNGRPVKEPVNIDEMPA